MEQIVTASSGICLKTRLTNILGGLHVDEHCWTLDKPMASLSIWAFGLDGKSYKILLDEENSGAMLWLRTNHGYINSDT